MLKGAWPTIAVTIPQTNMKPHIAPYERTLVLTGFFVVPCEFGVGVTPKCVLDPLIPSPKPVGLRFCRQARASLLLGKRGQV